MSQNSGTHVETGNCLRKFRKTTEEKKIPKNNLNLAINLIEFVPSLYLIISNEKHFFSDQTTAESTIQGNLTEVVLINDSVCHSHT